MRRGILLVVVLALWIGSQISYAQGPAYSYDYARMFTYTRALLTKKPVRNFLKETFREQLGPTNDFSEPQLMLLLRQNPEAWPTIDGYLKEAEATPIEDAEAQKILHEKWRPEFSSFITSGETLAEFSRLNDPLAPFTLNTASNEPGYSNVNIYFTHPRRWRGKRIAADNLIAVWVNFIRAAKKELTFNIFDFDITEVAQAMIERAKAGVKVSGGIDKNVIAARPEVKAVFDLLQSGGVDIHAVDPVSLNHQKIAARDWSLPNEAAVLLSSGNLTHSCIDPLGDLYAFKDRPALSIPNANHTITLSSDILANVVHHELTKTLDLGLRGREYPVTGAYKVMGPKNTYLIITFTPSGAWKSVNGNLISRLIASVDAPISMIQFAFSSKEVGDALFARAKRNVEAHKPFRFVSVGDKPFALADWSEFLEMSGLSMKRSDEGLSLYADVPQSRWRELLGDTQFEALRHRIYVAPKAYGERTISFHGESAKVSSKIHHKIVAVGPYAILGTSFNFSEGAETNNEQIVLFFDPVLAQQAHDMVSFMASLSKKSVYQAAMERTEAHSPEPTDSEDTPALPRTTN